MIKSLGCTFMFVLSLLWVQLTLATPQDIVHPQNQHIHEEKKRFNSKEEYYQYREQRKQEGEHHRHREKKRWKAGSTLPEEYRYADYQIDYTQYPKLIAPTRYQQWIKINDHFILMNVLTNTIIKVVPE